MNENLRQESLRSELSSAARRCACLSYHHTRNVLMPKSNVICDVTEKNVFTICIYCYHVQKYTFEIWPFNVSMSMPTSIRRSYTMIKMINKGRKTT